MSKTVIDVSSHQGSIDWAAVKGIDGVLIRLGYRGYGHGTLEMDKQFLTNVRGCITNGIPFGVYWFTTAISAAEGIAEADFVLRNISEYTPNFPIFIDSEYSNTAQNGRSDKLSKATRTAAVKAFCERIEQAGYEAGVYASESWFKQQLDVLQLPYRIWCAKYSSSKPTYPAEIDAWQYTSSGSVPGISGSVDYSHWYAGYARKTMVIKLCEDDPKTIMPVDYLQTDSRWKSKSYAAKGESSTIGSAGCGPTCAAMVIAALADPSVTPAITAAWSLAHGYKALHQGTYYSYFAPQMAAYGIGCKQLNGSTIYHGTGSAKAINAKALEAVKSGNWVIACMGKGDWTSSGHFVLWYGADGDKALIMDPNSTKASRRKAVITTFQYQAKFYWEIEIPNATQKQEEEDDMTKKEDVLKIINDWYYEQGLKPPAEDAKPALDWAYENGIMQDGAYERPATRTDVARVAKRLFDMLYNLLRNK